MQWEWQYGTVETKPLDPVSVDKFYESFDGREWHHALVVLPPTQKEQKLLKVRVLPSGCCCCVLPASVFHSLFILNATSGCCISRWIIGVCLNVCTST